jgi:hypothetical protein
MTDLSPAAQAVLIAVDDLYDFGAPENREIIAVALRAAVDVYLEDGNGEGPQWFLAIAAELEEIN